MQATEQHKNLFTASMKRELKKHAQRWQTAQIGEEVLKLTHIRLQERWDFFHADSIMPLLAYKSKTQSWILSKPAPINKSFLQCKSLKALSNLQKTLGGGGERGIMGGLKAEQLKRSFFQFQHFCFTLQYSILTRTTHFSSFSCSMQTSMIWRMLWLAVSSRAPMLIWTYSAMKSSANLRTSLGQVALHINVWRSGCVTQVSVKFKWK